MNMCKALRQEDINGKLPDDIALDVERAEVQSRGYPSIHEKGDKQTVKIKQGVLKVLESKDIENGMKFTFEREKIIAEDIELEDKRCRGSNKHHKYRLKIYTGTIKNASEWSGKMI